MKSEFKPGMINKREDIWQMFFLIIFFGSMALNLALCDALINRDKPLVGCKAELQKCEQEKNLIDSDRLHWFMEYYNK